VGIFKDNASIFFLTFLMFMGNHGYLWVLMGFPSASSIEHRNPVSSVYDDVSTITNMTLYYWAL